MKRRGILAMGLALCTKPILGYAGRLPAEGLVLIAEESHPYFMLEETLFIRQLWRSGDRYVYGYCIAAADAWNNSMDFRAAIRKDLAGRVKKYIEGGQ